MIAPKFGVITSIGTRASGIFRRCRRCGAGGSALAELLPADGKLFINGDSEWTDKIAARTKAKVIRVGLAETNDWRAKKIRLDKNGVTFQVVAPRRKPANIALVCSENIRRRTRCWWWPSAQNWVWIATKSATVWSRASRRRCG
jgi:UDP-N-acetylmuramoyl-tripeptide--D-alanyl-D-alanine ligase